MVRAHKYNLLTMLYLKIRQLLTNKIYYFETNEKIHSRYTVTSMNISLISIMHEMLLFNVWNQTLTHIPILHYNNYFFKTVF